jgi:spermidine synthase
MTGTSFDSTATGGNVASGIDMHRTWMRMAFGLAFASGAAGLIHQLLWTRRLVDLLGADTDTFARVTGTFFAGLAVGAWCGSQPAPPGTNFWRRVAVAEAAVAVLALPALFAASLSDRLWALITQEWLIDWFAPLALVGLPAGFMGLVLPWMIRGLEAGDRGNGAVWIYAVNLLGGISGVILIVHVGLPRVGLLAAGAAGSGLNLVACLAAAWLARGPRIGATTVVPASAPGSPCKLNLRGLRLLAFASGFLVLAGEVIGQHQFAQITVNSMFSSATVLVLVLAALTVGAGAVPYVIRWQGAGRRVLEISLLTAAGAWVVQPFLLVGLSGGLQVIPYELPLSVYTLQVAFLGLVTLGPAFLAAGMVFPMVLRAASEGGQGWQGREAGVVLAWNGLGGWLGAELGSFWIAPTLGLWGSVWLLAAIYGALGLGWAKPERGVAGWRRWLRPEPGLVGLMILGSALWIGRLPQVGSANTERVLAVVVAREGVVAAVERGVVGCGHRQHDRRRRASSRGAAD